MRCSARAALRASVFLALAWPCVPASAEGAGTPDTSEVTREVVATAPVRIDGDVLFRVRGVSYLPAGERADAIAGRIRGVARDPAIDPEALTARDIGTATEIVAGDRLVMTVSEADAALEGVDRASLATAITRRVGQAVETYRNDRDPRRLVKGALYAAAAALVLLIATWSLRRTFRWLEGYLERRVRLRIRSLQVASFTIVHAENAWAALRKALKAAHLLILLAFAYGCVEVALVQFPWTRPVAHDLLSYIVDPLRSFAAAIIGYVPKLLFLVVLAVVTKYVLNLVRLFFASVREGTVTLGGFDPDWAPPTFKIVRFLILVFALVVAYPYLPGSDSAAFKGLSLFVGVMLSIGSSTAVSNVVAGYSLIYRRAFRLGDLVQIGDQRGVVSEVRLLVTHLRTIKNEEIIIPNSQILNGHVVNFSSLARTQGLILHTSVGIGYETPWRQVEAMLIAAAGRTPGLKSDPPPFVLQKALGDFAVTYEINVFTDQPLQMARTYTDLHRNILDVFNEYGVQIMTPAYEGDPEQPKIVPKDQWHAPPAARPR